MLHYTSSVNVPTGTTTLTLSDGTTSKNVTVTYSAHVEAVVLQDVTDAITWSIMDDVTGSDVKGDADQTEQVYANIASLTFASTFAADKLTVKANASNYLFRSSNKCSQSATHRFHTTVPGIVTVYFSNTGGNPARYAVVNGTQGTVGSENGGSNGANAVNDNFYVLAGDVTITGTDGGIRVYKIVFTPVTSVNATIGSCEWATFSSKYPVNVSGISGLKAYKVTGFSGSAITKEEVTGVVPANTGLLLNGEAKTYEIPVAATAGTAIADNKLVAVTEETTVSAGTGTNVNYVLVNNGGNAEFQWIGSNSATVPAGRAYLTLADGPKGAGARLFIDDTTGIDATFNDNVEMINDNVIYDLSGRRVEKPTKGIYIMNGKKVVIR
ncbi:MAG: hypothetical protein IJ527_03295 [Prevotella sp.]|nr:hypothetical protein [Prevotella sp.]